MNTEQIGGLRFGRYQVVRPIGEGGMAQVYLAVRRGAGGFEKKVVLKVLHSRFLSSPAVVEMFLEEARVLARLRHPHIVDVFEVECVGAVPYLAMEHVAGPTLGDLKRFVGRPGPDRIGYFLLLIRQVCLALHHAHTLTVDGKPLGLVHRDVSSSNILVDASTGAAKLIDFGIAKAADSLHHTEVGVLKGKMDYMAPEVVRGSRPDARADIYAVGVLLYRLLVGRTPFRESDLRERERPVPYISLDTVDAPPGLAAITARAMSPIWEERTQTAALLAAELQAVIERLDVEPSEVAPFVAQVFPRGEEDWQRRVVWGSASDHSALVHLVSETASHEPVVAPPPGRRVWPVALALGTVALAGALALAVAVGAALPHDRSAEAAVLLDLADQLLEADEADSARRANEMALQLGELDPATATRAARQRTRIEQGLLAP